MAAFSSGNIDDSWTAPPPVRTPLLPQPREGSRSHRHSIISRIRLWFKQYGGLDLLDTDLTQAHAFEELDLFEYSRLQRKVQSGTAALSTSCMVTSGFFKGWNHPTPLLTAPYKASPGTSPKKPGSTWRSSTPALRSRSATVGSPNGRRPLYTSSCSAPHGKPTGQTSHH